MDTHDAQQIETWALRAWPALEEVNEDGWLLRFASGHTKRSNSVNSVARTTIGLDRKIEVCEHAYAKRGLPTIFRLTPFSEPAGLDAALEIRGYQSVDRTLVMTRSLGDEGNLPSSDGIRCVSQDAWLDAFESFGLLTHDAMVVRRQLVARMSGELIPLVANREQVIGINLGVQIDEGLGLFALHVSEGFRRLGIGSALVCAALHAGRTSSARTAYLQVEETNHPARRLYEQLGFEPAYPYWYRVRR